MTQQVEIPTETLRRAAEILLDRLATSSGAAVVLDKDMFWAIPAEHRANVYTEPTEFTVGQLTESLQNISRVVDDPSTATSYALVWLADLLRAAGEAVVE
jgi:hypothetical protein